jgi:hypothetical protein
LALCASLVVGCGKRDASAPEASATKPAPAAATAAPGTGDTTAAFRPPSDGRLTTASVERYLAIQKRVSELAASVRLEDGKGAADAVAKLAGADIRAAKELGYDPGESRWVGEKVAEALGSPADGMNVEGVLKGLNAATLEGLEARRAEAASDAERARLSQEIARMKADLDRRQAAAQPDQKASSSAVLEDNRKLLEPFRAALSALAAVPPSGLPKVAIATKPSAR